MGSRASLDRSPRSNWVQKSGELPGYVREIARALERGGMTLSRAIATAISRIKVWATGKGVSAKVQAKASAALAQWTALKIRNRSRMSDKVNASWVDELDAAADLVSLSALEDLLLLLSVERGYDSGVLALLQLSVECEQDRIVALSRVLNAANRTC